MPKFSIIIPAYKSYFLADAIDSCLSQSFKDFELIIIDDNSPENLFFIVSQFEDDRISYLRNKTNCGAVNVIDNWNKGLSLARGEYMICMGDDDKLLPNCLSLYIDLIEKYPTLDVFHSWTQIIDESSTVIEIQESRPKWESALAYLYFRWHHRWRQYIGDFCFRIDALRQAGGFYKLPLAWGSDDVTVFRAANGKGIANTQEFGFQYRKSSYTITNSGNQKIKATAHIQEWKWFKETLSKYVCKDENDLLFYSFLEKIIESHYQSKIKDMVEEDLTISAKNLSFWMRNCVQFNFSRKEIVGIFIHILRKNKSIHF